MTTETTLAAEQATLSAMLLEPDVIPSVRAGLKAEAFEDIAHQRLFHAMCAVHDAGIALDPITLTHHLETAKALEDVGGRDYLAYLIDVAPSAAHVQYHTRIVREKAQRRELQRCIADAAEQVRDGDMSTREIASLLQGSLLPLSVDAEGTGYREVTKLEIERLAEHIDDRAKAIADGRVAGIPTGFYEIDDVTNGFRPGELIIFGAVPKAWKSALVDHILMNAMRAGYVVGKVAAEMTREETLERMIASEARIESRLLSRGELSESEWQRYFQVAPLLSAGLHIDDQAWPSLDTVLARACDLKARVPAISVVAVDYLQLVTNRMHGRRGDEEINAICRALKGLAKKIHAVIIAPAQCNFKEIEARDDKRPTLRDIQGASGPVQDANFVGLLYNDRMYNPMAAPELEITFAASRRTETWIARLAMQPRYQRLENRRRP